MYRNVERIVVNVNAALQHNRYRNSEENAIMDEKSSFQHSKYRNNEESLTMEENVTSLYVYKNDNEEDDRIQNRYRNDSSPKEKVASQNVPEAKQSNKEENKTTIQGQSGMYTILTKITPELAQTLYAETGKVIPFEGGQLSTQYVSNKGKFGALRLGQDSLGHFVGIKEVVGKKVYYSREEARVQALGNGIPQVMPVLDAIESWDEDTGMPRLYVVMPLAALGNGKELVRYLHGGKTDPSFRMAVAAHTAQSLALGLRELHARKVYHLDIKPSNFVVDTEGRVQIIDFGCAKSSESGQFDRDSIGDSRYFAPERTKADENPGMTYDGSQVDAWALGMTMLKLIAGKFRPIDYTHPEDHPYLKEALTSEDTTLYQEVVRGLLNSNTSGRMTLSQCAEKLSRLPPIPPAILSYLREFVQNAQHKAQSKSAPSSTGVATVSQSIQQLPSPHFTGMVRREAAESEIKSRLLVQEQYSTVLFTACHGMGGVGKTTLATIIIHDPDVKARYPRIWWIRNADVPGSIALQLSNVAKELQLVGGKAALEEAVAATCRFLENQQEPWLLVLDNAGSPESIPKELIPSRGGHVLVTSRDPRWLSGINLVVMNPTESTEVFFKAFPDRDLSQEVDNVKKLAEELGYLPLAMTQAAAFIRQQQLSISDYLLGFQTQKKDMIHSDTPLFGKELPHSIVTLYGMQLTVLQAENPLALQLLKASSFMGSEDILVHLLKNCIEERTPDSAVQALVQYALWNPDASGESVSMHRLIQEVVSSSMEELESLKWLISLCKEVHQFFVNADFLSGSAKETQQFRIHSHLKSLLKHGKGTSLVETLDWANLLTDIGEINLYHIANYREALSYYNEALPTFMREYGTDHAEIGRFLTNQGNAYGSLGQYAMQEELVHRALNIFEKHYGPDHVQVAITLSNLGYAYENLGRYEEMREVVERALAIHEREYGPDHVMLVETLTNLANAYADLGKYSMQMDLLQRALAISEREFEADHIQIGINLHNLGNAYGNFGQYRKQIEFQERALDIFERAYGTDHSQVAVTLSCLGKTYGHLGEYSKQRDPLERALAIFEREYGPDHVKVADVLSDLGNAFSFVGKYEEMMGLLERAIVIIEREYGVDHVNYAVVLANLGSAHGYLGDYAKEVDLLERALAIQKRAYGKDHVVVAMVLHDLGVAYGNLGRHMEKKDLLERSLAIFEREYGPDHMVVGKILNGLGTVYGTMGEYAKQKELLERSLLIKEREFGPDHVEVANTLNNLGSAYGELGQHEEMRDHLERALAIFEREYGPDHVEVASALTNLGNAYGSIGHCEEQKILQERALGILLREYGADHVKVADALANLGNTYGEMQQYEEMKILLDNAVAIFERTYGMDHLQLVTPLVNLGKACLALGENEQRKDLLERALSISEGALGANHVEVACILNDLGNAYGALGEYERQTELLERSLTIKELEYGPDHLQVGVTLANLGAAMENVGSRDKMLEYYHRALMIFESVGIMPLAEQVRQWILDAEK